LSVDPGTLFQNEIREFLVSVGFNDVPPINQSFVLGGQEIDAFGRDGEFYAVIDAKTRTSLERSRGRNVRGYLSVINGYKHEAIRDIKNNYGSTFGYRDTAIIFWTRDVKVEKRHQERAKNLGIALRDDFDLKYYKEALKVLENKELVRNSFLKDIKLQLPRLNVFSDGHSINAKTIETKVGAKTLYTFPLEVRHLLKFAFVFRVEMNSILGESYQRLLKEKKVNKIRDYLGGGGYFPNNVIAVSEENLEFIPERGANEHAHFKLGELRLPDKPCYLEIIDGQHRLYGYSDQTDKQDHCLWVTIVKGLNRKDRAKLFVKINKTQTPVPPDILWDLYQISDPNGTQGKISKFVYELNDIEPLRDLISLPRVRSSRAYLSFSNFCDYLYTRSNLFSKYGSEDTFKNALKAYFEAFLDDPEFKADWDRSIDKKGKKGFVGTNNSMAVLLRLLAKLLEKTGVPSNSRMMSWKNRLQEWAVAPLKKYLSENAGGDANDPYQELRKLTSDKARKDAAVKIWQKSPLSQPNAAVDY